jgi:TolA-binding protein
MKRLLDEGGSQFEHSLLSALREEKPSPELVARMQEGLGLSAAASTGTTAGAASIGWVKAAFFGVAAVGLAAVGYVGLRPENPTPAVQPAGTPPLTKVQAPTVPESKPRPVAAPEAAPPQAPSTAKSRPVASVAPDLRDEIRLLDQARAAMREGEGSTALALLGKYARKYPRGQFRQEAQVLRVEALKQSGDEQAAVALGKKFVAAHPESPHVERVERATQKR